MFARILHKVNEMISQHQQQIRKTGQSRRNRIEAGRMESKGRQRMAICVRNEWIGCDRHTSGVDHIRMRMRMRMRMKLEALNQWERRRVLQQPARGQRVLTVKAIRSEGEQEREERVRVRHSLFAAPAESRAICSKWTTDAYIPATYPHTYKYKYIVHPLLFYNSHPAYSSPTQQ